jgi:hypothetical protein
MLDERLDLVGIIAMIALFQYFEDGRDSELD